MGSSSSKATRKLPKTPAWAGARTPPPSAGHGSPGEAPPSSRPNLASETRSQAIEQDARDPHFLANLQKLGPVRVDHHMQSVRTKIDDTNRMFQSRTDSEAEAAAPRLARNHLHAPSLSQLLDERKGAKSLRDIEELTQKWGIDVEKLESVARYVNSPSVQGGRASRVIGKDGDENLVMEAVWVNPRLGVS